MNKAYNKGLKDINYELEVLTKDLIEALKSSSIEYVDLYAFIRTKDNLISRKNKLQYLKALDI